MRVVHLNRELDPAMGGPTTVLLNTSAALARAGLDVEIWTTDAHGTAPPPLADGNGSLRLIERGGREGFLERRFFRRFRDDLRRIDLLHIHSLWRPYTMPFVKACEGLGVPTVHTMHGMLMDWPMRQKTLKKQTYLRLIAARQLRRTSAVHLLGGAEVEESRRLGVDFRYFHLPNGVDVSQFEALPKRGSFRATDPALKDKTIVMSLGRLHHVKGPEILLEAFLGLARDRPDLVLVMAGPDEGMLGHLRRMLQGHPAADRVRLPGLVGPQLRGSLLADADIFAHCSLHETASMSIIEAAYAGKCLLITDRCNCPEIGEADAGLVVPPTVESVGRGLGRLIDERHRMAERGANARAVVEQRFTLEAVTSHLIEHYRRLLAGERYPSILEP